MVLIFAGHVGNLFTSLKKGFRAVIPILILLVYTLAGAIIFMTIEGPNEQYELKKLKQQRERHMEVIFILIVNIL
jgi:hypothetical protein